jgi:hypothetical protein
MTTPNESRMAEKPRRPAEDFTFPLLPDPGDVPIVESVPELCSDEVLFSPGGIVCGGGVGSVVGVLPLSWKGSG